LEPAAGGKEKEKRKTGQVDVRREGVKLSIADASQRQGGRVI
jgi:hypothetical protein